MMAKSIEEFQAKLISNRVSELNEQPIKGNFDVAHLKAINHYLFQDFPQYNYLPGFDQYTPGKFRLENIRSGDWHKPRELLSLGVSLEKDNQFYVAYSNMTKEDIKKLEDILLTKADPEKLKRLDPKEVPGALADLYADLDYIHPFQDGNSRTLRLFTRQLAKESGYELKWEKYNPLDKTPEERQKFHDALFIARDYETTTRALPNLKDPNAKAHIKDYNFCIRNNKKLHEVFKEITSPSKERTRTKTQEATTEKKKGFLDRFRSKGRERDR